MTETLAYKPAELFVNRVIRPKYLDAGHGGIVQALAPERSFERSHVDTSLIAQIIVEKFVDHLPLDRQSKQFERLGLVIPRQTLCDLVGKAADLLQGVVAEMKRELPGSGSVPVDESRFGCWTRRSMNAAHKVTSGCWANRVATWFSSLTRAGAGNTRKSCSMGIGEFLSATDMASSER
jgi:transposase